MNISIARQWELLRIIPKFPNYISSRELKDKLSECGFESSKRTIERDLRDLSAIFPLASDESSQPFKWYWLKDVSSEFGGIALDEAISLSLAEDVLMTTLPEFLLKSLKQGFDLSNKKIRNLNTLSLVKLREKFRYVAQSLPFKKVSLRQNVLDKIKEALIENRQIKVEYDPAGKSTKCNIINPLAFVQAGVRPYLIATVEGEGELRQLALQRFRKIEVLDKKVKAPKGFSLDAYIASDAMQFGRQLDIKLKAIISENLATYLSESAISKDQKITYLDGKWHLSASLKDSWFLYFWIRSQGSEITILSPKRLRDKIIEDLTHSTQNYTFGAQYLGA